MHTALISAGSNQGNSQEILQGALRELQGSGLAIEKVSSFYRTKPWGNLNQPDFLNIAFTVTTALSPEDLLHLLLSVEQKFGRERLVHWGPRTLDLDLIDYAGCVRDSAFLTLPHPRVLQRAFVLVPAAEIAPHYRLTGSDLSVHEALQQLPPEEIAGVQQLTE